MDQKQEISGAPTPASDGERYYRISEVSRLAGLKPSVLRYWESEFPMLQPVKSTTGYRLYRQEDVDLVFKIKRLVYDEGLTLAGARKQLEEGSKGIGAALGANGAPKPETAPVVAANPTQAEPGNTPAATANGNAVKVDRQTLIELRDALRAFLTLLERK